MPNSSTIERERQADRFLRWKLRWRHKYLIVTPLPSASKKYCTLDTQRWLVECLKRSSVKGVYIDAALGEADVKLWVDACDRANKVAFLRLPLQLRRTQRQHLWNWKLQESIERAIAAVLILALSPILLGLYFLSRLQSSQPIHARYWCVDKRGKLFQLQQFQRSTVARTPIATPALEDNSSYEPENLLQRQYSTEKNLGKWLRQSRLDRLPQLFNALRNEFGIIEPQYLFLEQALKLSADEQHLLEALCQEPHFKRNAEQLQPAAECKN